MQEKNNVHTKKWYDNYTDVISHVLINRGKGKRKEEVNVNYIHTPKKYLLLTRDFKIVHSGSISLVSMFTF